MASVTELAYMIAAVKRIDFFHQFSSHSKIKTNAAQQNARTERGPRYLDHSHSSTHTLSTTGISTYSSLNIRGEKTITKHKK